MIEQKRLWASFIIMFGMMGNLFGQKLPERVSFDRISIPGTIRSSQMIDIVQDKLGLIWMAGDGLYRYDGYRFKQYRQLHNSTDLLKPREIHDLYYDSIRHSVLVGTQQSGIVQYNYRTDRLTIIPYSRQQPNINSITSDASGKIWATSYGSGLFFIENDTLRKFSDPERLIPRSTAIIADASNLYVGTHGKVVVIKNDLVVDEIPLTWQNSEFSNYLLPSCFFIDKENQLWIGTEKHGVFVYDLTDKKMSQYFSPVTPPFFSKISMIYQDSEGLIWILTKANGLVIYSPFTKEQLHLTRDPFSSKSLSSDNCFSIIEDTDGIIWIGATGDINKYDRHQLKFTHIHHNPLNKMSLSDNMVRGINEDKNGIIWIGTDGGYINRLNLEQQSIVHQRVAISGDSTNYVPLYFTELDDRIFLICTSKGILQYDKLTNRFTPYAPLWKFTQNKNIRQLLKHEEKLYFLYNGHLVIYDLLKDSTEVLKNAGELDAINITSILIDKQNRLWAGSNRGISLYYPKEKRFQFFPFNDVPIATEGSLLFVLSIDQIGNKLYIGTFNAGLWEMDISNINAIPPPRNITHNKNFPSNTVYGTLQGNDGNLWLSTNHGLVKYDLSNKRFVSFTISEGIQEEEFNRLAYTQTKSGNLIFGGINGINVFNPKKIEIEQEKFIPYILAITGSSPLNKESGSSRITDFSKPPSFEYNQNFINITFFVPHYEQPKRYTLYYKLDNYEKEWNEATTENTITYSNLQPGSYTFLLKTVDLNGEEQSIRVPFGIEMPYWKTWWFVALTIIVITFLIATIILSYIKKSQKDRDRLEQLLKIRTAEIEKSREELQVLNQKKDLIFSILSHDLRSPLTTLKGFLGYLINHAEELSTAELKRHAINIKNSVTNSLDLIDNTLFWSLSQMGNIQYTPNTFSLHALLQKLHGLYQLTADKKRIAFSIICNENIMLYGDENMVYVTLRNLVSNALKFTSEGNPVSITCEVTGDMVEIRVADRGIGMSHDYIQRILSMDQPMLKKGTSNEKGTGLGLLLCKNFIEQNKGKLFITSMENIGTTFTVILPLAVKHVIEKEPVTATD